MPTLIGEIDIEVCENGLPSTGEPEVLYLDKTDATNDLDPYDGSYHFWEDTTDSFHPAPRPRPHAI